MSLRKEKDCSLPKINLRSALGMMSTNMIIISMKKVIVKISNQKIKYQRTLRMNDLEQPWSNLELQPRNNLE